MSSTIPAGKHLASMVDLSASEFRMTKLTGAVFDDVDLSGATFNNINFSDVQFKAAQIGGSHFKHIGPPPAPDGVHPRQRPVTFEDMQLCDSTFHNVDMSNVRITDCNFDGMTIEGVLVSELFAAYRRG